MINAASMGRRGALHAYGILSLACVGVGCVVAGASGVPVSIWARNPAAWALGLVAAVLTARTGGLRTGQAFLLGAPLGLALTLLSAGLNGVHRWTHLGPLQLNLGEILLPPAVVALSVTAGSGLWPWLAAAATMAILIAQPDASQATAFGGAVVATLMLLPSRRPVRLVGVVLTIAAIVVAWLRPDPLSPVPEVEGILGLAWVLSPFVAILAAMLLTGAALVPWLAGPATRRAGWPLSAYFLLSAAAPALAAFPVPLVGMGMSPILGFWLGVGLLAAQEARHSALASPP